MKKKISSSAFKLIGYFIAGIMTWFSTHDSNIFTTVKVAKEIICKTSIVEDIEKASQD